MVWINILMNLSTKELMKFLYEDNSKDEATSKKIQINDIESIKISNLSFKYPGHDKKVVDNISLSIRKGENIAIVGENGSGKSTLINIILGLFRDYEGQILINDVDFKNVELQSYRSCISVVLQDFMRYIYSVRENIAIGDISELKNSNKIEHTIKNVGIDKKIKEFSNGIDTMLSKEYEGGKELSGS